jgi:hypothetical protein
MASLCAGGTPNQALHRMPKSMALVNCHVRLEKRKLYTAPLRRSAMGHPDPFYLWIIIYFGRGGLKDPEPVVSHLFGIALLSNTPPRSCHKNIKHIATT